MLAAFVATELALWLASGHGSSASLSGRQLFSGQTSVPAILTNLLLVQGLGFHEHLTWNGGAWSISTEMWTYVIFALIAVRLARHTVPIWTLLILATLPIVLPPELRPAGVDRFVDIARCIYGFGIGIFLRLAYERTVASPALSAVKPWHFSALEIAGAALAFAFVAFADLLPRHLLAPIAFAPAVYVFAFDGGRISRVLHTPFIVWLGTLSYSIYMIHGFVQARIMLPLGLAFQKVTGIAVLSHADGGPVWGMGGEASGLVAVLVMLALLILCSAATYRLIEEPGRTAMRRWVAHHK